MKVKFFNNIEYQTFPLTEDMIDIDEEVLKEIGVTKQYLNGEIVDYIPVEAMIIELKEELATYDYIGNKIATGVATKEDYSKEIEHCENLRKRIRELEKSL